MEKRAIGALLTDTHMSEDNLHVQVSIFDQTIEFCVDNQLKYIFHGGDILHSRKSQSQIILTTFEKILDKIHAAGLQMISIVGNHDKTDYDSEESFLSSFKHHPGLRLIEQYDIDAFEGCAIAFLSFFSDTIYNEKLQLLKDKIKQEQTYTQFPVMLLTHIGVNGARMNNGTAIESNVKVKQFDIFQTVKIGHYHNGQSFGNIEYIGASIQHNFGEGLNKGIQILFNDFTTELIPLEFPQYLKYEVDVTQLTQKDLDDLRQEKENSDNFIRVVLVGQEKDVKSYNIQSLKQVGVDIQMKVPDIEITELQKRIEPFTAQSLKQQFELFCQQNELDYEQGMVYFNSIIEQNV